MGIHINTCTSTFPFLYSHYSISDQCSQDEFILSPCGIMEIRYIPQFYPRSAITMDWLLHYFKCLQMNPLLYACF